MPASYAHDRFGNDVLRLLPADLRTLLESEKAIYDIGVQGPDIFFYYRPLLPGPVKKVGGLIHAESGRAFFTDAFRVLREKQAEQAEESLRTDRWSVPSVRDASLAYVCGCLCHFVLDSHCHPAVFAATAEKDFPHADIEGQFDRFLMVLDGEEPVETDVTAHFHPTIRSAAVIEPFYPLVPFKKTAASLKGFVRIHAICRCPDDKKRNVLYTGIRLIGKEKSLHGHIITKEADPAYEATSAELVRRYAEAIPEAVRLINGLWSLWQAGIPDTEKDPVPYLADRAFDLNYEGDQV